MAVKKWRGKWVVDLLVDGQRVRRVSPEQTKDGARKYEAELVLGLCPGTYSSGRGRSRKRAPTLAEFGPEWLTTYAMVNNKPSERIRKECDLRNHLVPFFGNRRLDEISPLLIEEFKASRIQLGLKNASINRLLSSLKKLLVCAEEWERIERVPRIRMLPEPQGEFDWLQPREARRLLRAAEAFSVRWYTFFLLALRTGMRKGEMFGLHWRQVDFARKRITVKYNAFMGQLGTPKSGKTRVLPMTDELASALERWRAQVKGKLVFPGRDGGVVLGQAVANQALDRVLKAAGLRKIRVHDLRHTFASHLVTSGRSLREVQLLLGHKTILMTERYAHLADEQLANAVSVLDALGHAEGDQGDS